MFREFNVKFEDVEMLGGADNLLEGTEITKVIVRGDNNKMSSLDSMLKDCNELDTIDGELDLNGVSDIDNLLEGTELVKSIDLKNINNENITANNSFPYVDRINIGGEVYNKKAMQNVIASKDWTFDNITYNGTVGDNVVTKEVNIIDDNKATIKDTLEQKATGIEIIGQTYENLVVGSGEATLLDELTLESIDGNTKEFNPHLEQPICVEAIEGETYQNLVEGKGEYKLTDTFSTTWTEENNTLENMPNAIEIPEIWGNTVQGYARAVSNKDLVNHMNNLGYSNVKFELIDDDTMIETNWGYWQPENYRDTIASDNSKALQLKPNTSYSFRTSIPFFDRSAIVSTTNILLSLKDTLSGTFTTDDTGLVAIVLMTNPHNTPFNFILVEGDVVPNIPFDLNYIQSVGDLYVDEEGTPILDEEGNEQYKLEIESSNTLFNEKYLKDGFKKELYNGRYVYHATGSTIDNGLFVYNKYKFKENTQYHIKYECANINNLSWKYLEVEYTDKTKGFTTIVDNLDGKNHILTNANKTVSKLGFTIEGRYNPLYIYADSIIISETDDNYDLIETDKTTILMPQPLRRVDSVSDKLYWDNNKNKYIVEKNIDAIIPNISEYGDIIRDEFTNNERFTFNVPSSIKYSKAHTSTNDESLVVSNFIVCNYGDYDKVEYRNGICKASNQFKVFFEKGRFVTVEKFKTWFENSNTTFYYSNTSPQIIETKILEKPSLETYSPKTYISTNTEIQPSQMTITNKKVDFIPLGLQANKDYTLQLDSVGKDDKPITVNLGGTETTVQPINDTSKHHKVVVRTPNTLTTDKLDLSGEGVVVNDVMLFEGESNEIKQDVGYVDGIESIGEYYLDYHLNLDEFSSSSHSSYYKLQDRNINVLQVDNRAGANSVLLGIKNGDYTIDVTDNTIVQIFTASGTWVTQLSNGENINITEPIRVKLTSTNNTYPFTTHFNLKKDNSVYEECYKIDILSHEGGLSLTNISYNYLINAKVYMLDGWRCIILPFKSSDVFTVKKKIRDGSRDFRYCIFNSVSNTSPSRINLLDGGFNSEETLTWKSSGDWVGIGFVTDYKTDLLSKVEFSILCDNSQIPRYLQPIEKQSSQSILLPQPLNKIGEIKDKFYWDDNKGYYCIEENAPKIYLHTLNWVYTYNDNLPEDEICFMVSNYCQSNNITLPSFNVNIMKEIIKHNIPILNNTVNDTSQGVDAFAYHGSGNIYFRTKRENLVDDSPIQYLKEKGYFVILTRPTPNIIDLPHYSKKYSLDTYMPTTYLECTNSPMQPSRILLESDTVRYKPSVLVTDTDYTIQFECKEKSDKKVKLNLGGTEKEVDVEVGLNHVSITTPSEIDTSLYKDRLFLSGAGNKVADVIVNKGEMNQYPEYFNGIQNTGELQDDGTYKIDVETYSQTNNIFNPNQKYVDGKFINDNGVEQINAGYGYTIDFIKSNPNTRYVGQNTSCIYCYDDNKQFISRIPFWGSGTIVSSATPSNCYYVRFQLEWSKLPNKDLRLHKVAEGNSVIDIDDWKSFTISVTSNNPLAKGDKLYWNKSNKRYEIDRGGSVEVPTVSGDVIDLPRLYQREDTHFSTSTGNIKPSKIKLDYNDLD